MLQTYFKCIQVVLHISKVTCDSSGRIALYHFSHKTFVEENIMQLSQKNDENNEENLNKNKYSKPFCCATKLSRFDHNTYLVGTNNGAVYMCAYDNSTKYLENISMHYGMIKSLEKSPHTPEIILTIGCDYYIKIWIGVIFSEPVIMLDSIDEQSIKKAIWSPTNSTMLASMTGKVFHINKTYTIIFLSKS